MYGCFNATITELKNYDILSGPQSQKYLLAGPLQKKITDPDLNYKVSPQFWT